VAPYVDPSQVPELPLEFMNADHAREIRLLEQIGDALAALSAGTGSVGTVLERLSVFAVHTREHFLREEQAMREAGFPAYPVHKAEHDRVLGEMDAAVRAFRDGGDPEPLRSYLFDTVPAWFVNHIRTMDSVTARFVVARQAERRV
jgi:hemerythrin